jgi:CRP-like cAMP-binding protein
LRAGDLFIFDCGDLHEADCDAIVDSVVVLLDREQLDKLARHNHQLKSLLSEIHANELQLILQSLGRARIPPFRAPIRAKSRVPRAMAKKTPIGSLAIVGRMSRSTGRDDKAGIIAPKSNPKRLSHERSRTILPVAKTDHSRKAAARKLN